MHRTQWGRPPRTTLNRNPLGHSWPATRSWFWASEKLPRRYGSGEGAPTASGARELIPSPLEGERVRVRGRVASAILTE
jgi:hypothetical protein